MQNVPKGGGEMNLWQRIKGGAGKPWRVGKGATWLAGYRWNWHMCVNEGWETGGFSVGFRWLVVPSYFVCGLSAPWNRVDYVWSDTGPGTGRRRLPDGKILDWREESKKIQDAKNEAFEKEFYRKARRP